MAVIGGYFRTLLSQTTTIQYSNCWEFSTIISMVMFSSEYFVLIDNAIIGEMYDFDLIGKYYDRLYEVVLSYIENSAISVFFVSYKNE